jgi:hypothetical protein
MVDNAREHGKSEGHLMTHIEGRCLCGKVSYSADADPVFVGVCHCTDCQHFTGSAFATVMALPAPALKVTGTLTTFTKCGDTGKPIHRRFCPECGSGVVDEADALPGVVMVNVGTLDDPTWIKPQSEVYCDSAQPWVRLGGELHRFGKMPA